ncbi:MAG: VTT domain-containing protein [Angelakisella sp.]|nr:VTT domain-containing protein [Angelakisella sp.]
MLWLVRFLPLLAVAYVLWRYGAQLRGIQVQDILNYKPQSYLLAAVGLIGMYGVKSVTIVFPLIVLYVASGILFDPLAAVLLNIAGLWVAVSIPYGLGRYYGAEYVERLVCRYKKAEQLHRLQGRGGFFISYITRVINLLPGDVVSMLLGALNVGYWRYTVGSLLGLVPTMLAATFIGVSITDPTSVEFMASCAMTIIISVVSVVLYRRHVKHSK